ncbi:hypothetical protein DKX38_028237 [Salix brachista]|uniref:Uncharacterized protein n=1 Tax=Salix brachista TaxID=2182728 RepID=A0A5N5J5A6_9ROSI|nr:hypothetical protein DKX38_028237 [Salix brachista]
MHIDEEQKSLSFMGVHSDLDHRDKEIIESENKVQPSENGANKYAYKCSHYDQTNHSKSRCFELVVIETHREYDIVGRPQMMMVIDSSASDHLIFDSSQMEYQEEVQTLDYDVCISTKVPPNNQDMSVVDTSINLDSYNSTSGDNNDTKNGNDSQICNRNSGFIDASVINLEDAPIIRPVRTVS